MSILTAELPKTVLVGGVEVPIKWGFRTSILFGAVMQDGTLEDVEKLKEGLRLYFTEEDLKLVTDVDALFLQMLQFFSGEASLDDRKGRKTSTQAFSYEHDDRYIYAAFLDQYGVDLTVSDMHWWQFRAMFDGLREDMMISKIMHYRVADLSQLSAPEKKHYQKMRKHYALPKSVNPEEQEVLDRINEALEKGEDVGELLKKG